MAHQTEVSPDKWVDHKGVERFVPVTRWRLKFKIPSHRALRVFVFERDQFECQHCGAVPDEVPTNYDGSFAPRIGSGYLVVDHKISRCRGDGCSHHPSNLQSLCDSCNARKRNLVDIRGVDTCRA
jgi:5-methylcytosine-specific restriction endonuclease McrA